MRRCTALALVVLAVLFTACGRQPSADETVNAFSLPNDADSMEIALPETTQAACETFSQIETVTESATTQPPVTTTQSPVTTTQPPVTTTQPPETTTNPICTTSGDFEPQPPESGSVPFTVRRVQIYRNYKSGFEPSALVTESREQLSDALCALADQCHPDNVKQKDVAAYTDEWFETHRLIVITAQESSGSIRHDVRKVTYTENGATVKLKRWHPYVCTCDIAHWLIFIELSDTHLHSGDPVELIWA